VHATTSQPSDDGQELDDEFMVVWEGYPATCQLNLVNVAAEMLHICQEKPAHFISKLLRIIVSCS